jgi:carboxymethylenebutenolidase
VNAFERYVVEEHVEDFNDHLISRRELLRRVTLITGSLVATLALLEAMGCGTQPSGSPPSPGARATPGQARPYATPPAQMTTDGITVQATDPRINVVDVTLKGSDGASLISYYAAPAGLKTAPNVYVVHENRGLVEHIRDVVRRVATAGFNGAAVDLLSRDGGADKLSDPAAYAAALAKRSPDAMVADIKSVLQQLDSRPEAAKGIQGITGFCFGGGVVWNVLAAGTPLKAAVPFYGPAPQDVTTLASTRAAVLAIYAELDTRITASGTQVEAQLKKGGHTYQIKVEPGVNHAFHNDTGPRYAPKQAEDAWVNTVDWFRKYLV